MAAVNRMPLTYVRAAGLGALDLKPDAALLEARREHALLMDDHWISLWGPWHS